MAIPRAIKAHAVTKLDAGASKKQSRNKGVEFYSRTDEREGRERAAALPFDRAARRTRAPNQKRTAGSRRMAALLRA
jgi:hypothetical protein